MFTQAELPIEDAARFAEVKAAVEQLFQSGGVAEFLGRLERKKLTVRDFETILRSGFFGSAAETYRALGPSDQGQIRELYLRLVERVAPELRAKYLKVYAYY